MYNNIIVVPYRDRESHLNTFKGKINDYFIKLLGKDTLIVVIEQTQGKDFNRGKLLNIGIKEFSDCCKGYFILHDVDTFLKKDHHKLQYKSEEQNIIRLWRPHALSLGGICKIKKETILDINGHPNNIWGWGIEDRALYYRALIKECTFKNVVTEINDLQRLHHTANSVTYTGERKEMSEYINSITRKNLEEKENFIYHSGISTLSKIDTNTEYKNEDEYFIIKTDTENNYIKLLVDI
jgi:hypothetical protein